MNTIPRIKVFSWIWWACVLVLLVACNDSTAPESTEVEMSAVEIGPQFLYANPRPGGSRGVCDPGGDNDSPTNVPKVSVCFKQFATALGVSGVTIGLCAAEASGAGRVTVAIAKWSACLGGAIKSLDSWGNWLDATQIDGYYDWSEREIANRMREAIWARCACGYRGGDR